VKDPSAQPFGITAFVSQGLSNDVERRQVLVGAFEIGNEVVLVRTLISVRVVIAPAIDRLNAGLGRLSVTCYRATLLLIDMRIEVGVPLQHAHVPPGRRFAHRNDDHVPRRPTRLPRGGALVHVLVQCAAGVPRGLCGAFIDPSMARTAAMSPSRRSSSASISPSCGRYFVVTCATYSADSRPSLHRGGGGRY